jgi:large subunit ribosomal protein L17
MALSKLDSKDAMRKLFTFAPQNYAGRNGGYTRITKIGPRLGDGAMMAQIELV